MAATTASHGLPSERAPSVLSSSSKLTAQGHSTVSLTKRLLFPHLPPSSPPPPLLQTSSSYPALDAELYDFIALALRAYINPWWTKITRYDKQLLLELTRIFTSVLRNIEARALAADLSPLLYFNLPTLLAQHCADYRMAARKLGSSYAAAGSASLPVLFHGQQQHVGVSIDGKADEVYVRAAVDVVLKACLSPEDWDAEAERYIIRETIVKTMCIDIVPRITQPWFLHSTLLNLLGPPDEPLKVSTLHLLTCVTSLELTVIQVPRASVSLSSQYVSGTFIAHYDSFFSLYRPGYFKYRTSYNSNIQACRSHHQDGTQLANTCPTTIPYSYSDVRGHTPAIAIDSRNTIHAT